MGRGSACLFPIRIQARAIVKTGVGVCAWGTVASAQPYDLSWHTIDSGGATATTGGTWELSGTIGQLDAGTMTGGTWQLSGGFWPGVAAPVPVPGDSDGDGDVDLIDYSNLLVCLNGPGGSLPPACDAFDSDADGDVDLQEYAQFQTLFSGALP